MSLQWRHNGRDSVSNYQPHDCFPNRLFRRRSTKTSKHRVTGLCAENSPGTGEFTAQMASNADNVSVWRRHHVKQQSFTRRCPYFRPVCMYVCMYDLDTNLSHNTPWKFLYLYREISFKLMLAKVKTYTRLSKAAFCSNHASLPPNSRLAKSRDEPKNTTKIK